MTVIRRLVVLDRAMGDFSRRPDWEIRLAKELAAAALRNFEWGVHDCARFAARGFEAQTGAVPWSADFGSYRTELGAARAIARAGGFEAPIDRELERRTEAVWAARGDVGLVDLAAGPALGLVDQGVILIAASPRGLGALPLRAARIIWKV